MTIKEQSVAGDVVTRIDEFLRSTVERFATDVSVTVDPNLPELPQLTTDHLVELTEHLLREYFVPAGAVAVTVDLGAVNDMVIVSISETRHRRFSPIEEDRLRSLGARFGGRVAIVPTDCGTGTMASITLPINPELSGHLSREAVTPWHQT